jgi:predicted transposase/invertase (TIGR01784 family)
LNKEIEEIINRLRPVDDIFFHKLSEKREFCEELLQTILGNEHIKLRENTPQKSLRNVKGKSVTIDLLCQDKKRVMYGVEMQRKNYDNHQKRVRYTGANIDTYITEKGVQYKDLWKVYIIYISEFDIFHGRKTVYHVKRVVEELGKKVHNDYDEIYVNTKVNDGSRIAELMQIFTSSEVPSNSNFPKICNTIREYKEGKRREEMCTIVEEYGKKQRDAGVKSGKTLGRKELMTVVLLLKKGSSKEQIKDMGYDDSTIEDAYLLL